MTVIVLAGISLLTACNKDDINQLPNAATLVSPADGALVAYNNLAFEFTEGSDPEQGEVVHRVMITDDSITWYNVEWEHSPILCDLEFKEGQKYHWKVQVLEYDEQGSILREDRMTESKVHYFHTNSANVFELKAESSSNSNWTGHSFVKLEWLEPENTDYVEVTFEPQVPGITQPIEIRGGTNELLIKDFFNSSEALQKEDAKMYKFAVKAYNTDGLVAVPDTIKAMPLDQHLVHDYDFNVYGVVIINEQAWLDANLMTTHYNDGTEMPHYKGLERADYGYYYPSKIFTTNPDKNPCPKGFHVPTEEEWRALEEFIGVPEDEIDNPHSNNRGDEQRVANQLKSKTGWNNYSGFDGNGNDVYGFNAKPAGMYHYNVDKKKYMLGYIGEGAYFWTVDENKFYLRGRNISGNRNGIYFGSYGKTYSIRCIRDN